MNTCTHKPTQEIYIHLMGGKSFHSILYIMPRCTYQKGTLFVVDVSINRAADRTCHTKLLDTWKAAEFTSSRKC